VAELCAAIVSRKNRENALRFLRTPYSQRVVFVPQCLRSAAKCQAEEKASEYVCRKCGACKIADIVQRAADLGYAGVRILKGGSVVPRLLEEIKPKAVVGIACSLEGALGMMACERAGAAVMCVPLLRDGCSDTDVDIAEVADALEAALP